MNARSIVSLLAVSTLLPATASALATGRGAGTCTVTLRAGVPMGSVVAPGERMSFEFQVSNDATVVVFDIDTGGQVHLLYPEDGVTGARARQIYRLPEDGSDLVVAGERGAEFIFALAVSDPASIDPAQLDRLRNSEYGRDPYRVEGDPFLAANSIAGDLVRDVSRSGASFGYTYFYVSERVDHPCYLCGPCADAEEDCGGSRFVQNFDRRAPLSYPLSRGYDEDDVATSSGDDSVPSSPMVIPDEDDDVVVNFYPYGTEVRYVDPVVVGYNDWWWYDPFFWGYPGWYPYCPGFSVSVGFGRGWGWGWGPWGGYYCSGWYDPWWCGGGYYGRGYRTRTWSEPTRFKTKYKSNYTAQSSSLARNRTFASKHDGDLRIASAGVRPSVKQPMTSRAFKTRAPDTRRYAATRAGYSDTRSRGYVPRTHTRTGVRSGTRGGASYHHPYTSGAVRSKASSSGTRVQRGYRSPHYGTTPHPTARPSTGGPSGVMKSNSGSAPRSSPHSAAPGFKSGSSGRGGKHR